MKLFAGTVILSDNLIHKEMETQVAATPQVLELQVFQLSSGFLLSLTSRRGNEKELHLRQEVFPLLFFSTQSHKEVGPGNVRILVI